MTTVFDYMGRPVVPGGSDPYWTPQNAYGDAYFRAQGQGPRATNPGVGGYTMPNYNQPQYFPGMSTGGYGMYGTPNTSVLPQTAGGPVGQGGGRGVIDYDQLLENPRQFVINAMLEQGINPSGLGMLTRATLNKAEDLVAQLYPQLLQGALGGGQSGDVLGRLGSLGGDLVRRAVGGQAVFPGAGQGYGQATQLAGLARQLSSTPDDPLNQAQQLARRVLGDPNQAAGLLSSLLYGGTNERLAGTLRGGLQDAGFLAQRQAQRTGQNVSFLEMLLSGGLSGQNIFGR